MPIAENLKYWMDVRHVTTAALSAKANVPEATITKIRTRITMNPNMETLKRLAAGLDVSVNDLTDTPSVEDAEIRDLLPKKIPTDPEELVAMLCSTLRNQRLASDRTMAEIRKDRNGWRRFAVICLSVIIPLSVASLAVLLFMYWDLSHPGEGNILLNYALEHYNLH